jgi:hypothetical protein
MVRHILIAYRGSDRASPDVKRKKWQAKELADSLRNVIENGTAMTDLLMAFTDDPGSSAENLGNYGMFARNSGFVKEFKDAGFNNPVGATVVVETEFGYHVIQVLARRPKQMLVHVLPLERIIDHELNYIAQQQVATLPVFPGGITALINYLNDSMRYPVTAKTNRIQVSVEITFRIGNDGKIYNVSELTYGSELNAEFVDEAKRLVAAMPQWKPAMYKGKEIDWILNVRVPFLLIGN